MMKAAATKKLVTLALADRFGDVFERRKRPPVEILPTGIAELDSLTAGFPRGAITEIHGATSSGRTSLLLSTVALATAQAESCALVDCGDTFDLSSAAKAGVDFDRLLWVRCNQNLERAFKAVDLLVHGGGFGLVALNLSEIPAKSARRIISSWWFRLRRAIADSPTVLIVITSVACVRSCAALVLGLKKETTFWPSTLSLVFENRNSKFADNREVAARHLSLVAASPPPPVNGPPLSHSYVIESLRVRANQERPVECGGISFRVSSTF